MIRVTGMARVTRVIGMTGVTGMTGITRVTGVTGVTGTIGVTGMTGVIRVVWPRTRTRHLPLRLSSTACLQQLLRRDDMTRDWAQVHHTLLLILLLNTKLLRIITFLTLLH